MSKDMIKKFISDCLEEAKEEYFSDDHHSYGGEAGKDVEWRSVFDEDIFFEFVLGKIELGCPDLYRITHPFDLYHFCLTLVKGE